MAKKRRRATDLGAVTKKDFQTFAKILCRREASSGLVGDLADYFKGQNPRFDRDRFVRATQKC